MREVQVGKHLVPFWAVPVSQTLPLGQRDKIIGLSVIPGELLNKKDL